MIGGAHPLSHMEAKRTRMRRHIITIVLIVAFLGGLTLLLYPTVSDWWNFQHQSRAVSTYIETVAQIDNHRYEQIWGESRAYNAKLAMKKMDFQLTDEQLEEYNELLNVSGNGIMGVVNIPTINVTLPIYHGTDESVLQIAIGHIAGTSLPVGGESTHCVISGHRGLPRAKLFTDIDKLVVGDRFTLNVLDEVLTYEVDQIRIVLPYELENLSIEEGKDYCTLVTCTPYGINTHRLLIRGHRIETKADAHEVRITADALQIDEKLVAIFIAAPLVFLLGLGAIVGSNIQRKRIKK